MVIEIIMKMVVIKNGDNDNDNNSSDCKAPTLTIKKTI